MQARTLFVTVLLALGLSIGAPAARSQTAPTLPPPPPVAIPAVPAELAALLATGSPTVWTACSAATSTAFLLSVGAAIANPIGIPIPPEFSAILAGTGAYVSTASTPCYVFPQPPKAQVCGVDAELTAIPFVLVTPGAMIVSQLAAVEAAIVAAGVPAGAPISQAVADALSCAPALPPVEPPDTPSSPSGSSDDDAAPAVAADEGERTDDGSTLSLVGGAGGTFADAIDGVLPDGTPIDGIAAPQTAFGVNPAAESTPLKSPLRAILIALMVFVGLLVLSSRMGTQRS